jgi:putative DNA primase/helicase
MNNNDALDNSPPPGLDHNAGPDGLFPPNTLELQGGDPKTDAPRERITGSVKTEHRPAREQPRSGLNLVRASDLTPQPVDWLWDGWLAAGKVHILGGAPGTGKTTISLSLAATVTTGGSWPDDSPSPMGNVVIWSGEDDPADTLLPRLILCGADESSVFFATDVVERGQSRPFDPTRDLGTLKQRIAEIGNVSCS